MKPTDDKLPLHLLTLVVMWIAFAVALCFVAQPQELVHVERRTLPHDSRFHPFSRNIRRSAKGSVNRLTIFHEWYELLRCNLSQKPHEACTIAESLNVCSRFANLSKEFTTYGNLPSGMPRLKFLLRSPENLEVFWVNLWHRFSPHSSEDGRLHRIITHTCLLAICELD
jgi:hypothetical protein